MNKLLQRQIEKFLGDVDSSAQALGPLIDAISDAYDSFETDRRLIERALDLSSEELTETNRQLRQEVIEREKAQEHISCLNRLKEDLIAPVTIDEKLRRVTDSLVKIFDADFSSIWIIKPGDLCNSGCAHAEVKDGPHACRHRDCCLHLTASSGRYVHIDGRMHRRVPYDCYTIGCLAAGEDSRFITNDVTHESHIHNKEWAEKLGLVSFAGYRLVSTELEPVGVLALFSKHEICANDDTMLETIAKTVSQVIQAAATEEELRKTEEKYRVQFEGALDAIFVADVKTGKLIDCNPAGTKLVDREKSELIGKSHKILHPPMENEEEFYETFRQHFEEQQGQTLETQVITAGGEIKDVAIKANLLELGGTKIMQGIFRDITEHKQAERELKRINEKLVDTNRQLQEFIYVASHDLKEPLRKVSAFADILKDALSGKLNDDELENFDFMIDGANRMRQLVGSLLAYSKLMTKDIVLKDVDLNIALERLKNMELSNCIEEECGKILVPDTLPTIQCDPTQIKQLLLNLIENALRYHKENVPPIVTVRSYSQEDGRIRVEIEDNGIGIKREQLENIFAMFKRMHSRQEYEGVGIGLTLCKKIIEKHKGEIGVSSAYGEGSTFWFTLPVLKTLKKRQMELLAGSTA
jgi:PAS domain S-box-containing protein